MKNETQHKERPLLFSGPMVKAILEGRKTMTRRVVKPEPEFDVEAASVQHEDGKAKAVFQSLSNCSGITVACPYGRPGDMLWVRETWAYNPDFNPPYEFSTGQYVYRADFGAEPVAWNWRPSIHMPRAASRILLKITEIRVERLRDISEQDAKAEGVEAWAETLPDPEPFTARSAPSQIFSYLWQYINGPESWDKNPWVWAITFKRI